MILVNSLFTLVFLILLVHFTGLFILKFIKIDNHTKIYGKKNRLSIYITRTKNLMVQFTHLNEMYEKEEFNEDDTYSHELVLEIGGLFIMFKFWKNFKISNYYTEPATNRYGFYSSMGELLWREIWWGEHLYETFWNPTNKYLGCKILNPTTGEMTYQRKDLLVDDDCVIRKDYNTIYTAKNGEHQKIKNIKWWIEERRWTNKIVFFLKLYDLLFKRRVDLSFDSDTGMGTERDSWKGGVMGSSINLCSKIEKPFLRKYDEFIKSTGTDKFEKTRTEFMTMIYERIDYFMKYEQKY